MTGCSPCYWQRVAPLGASRKVRVIRPPRIVLATDQSNALRDRLVAGLKSADEAADWVHENLPTKNTLAVADAETVEASFRERSSRSREDSQAPGYRRLLTTQAPHTCRNKAKPSAVRRRLLRQRQSSDTNAPLRRPCVCAARSTADSSPRNPASSVAARPSKHITLASPHLGRKVSDEYTVPVCRVHHRDLYGYGDEASWWVGIGIDPLPIALELWQRSS